MIATVNYGLGNLFSLSSSLRYLGIECQITADPQVLDQADQVILPGVGAYGDAMRQLTATGLDQAVIAQARKGKPVMGICLGMQLLYEEGLEYGRHAGLGLIPGAILPLEPDLHDDSLKVPQMGWNSLIFDRPSPLLAGSEEGCYVYYVHSFYAPKSADTTAHSVYGQALVTGAVQHGNVYGTQFHPEKSGKVGLRMLQAFADLA